VNIKLVAGTMLVAVVTHGSGMCAEGARSERTPVVEERKPLEIRMSGATAMAPATLRGLIIVSRDTANRLLRVSIEGESLFRSSDIALEGAESPQSHFLSWRDLPPGHYIVTAVLYGSTGARATVVRNFLVVGGQEL
jgi:hypothetical protein